MISNTIIKPIISEKSMAQAANGRYTFQVDRLLNKYQIKNLIETAFQVKVVSVKTVKISGKRKRVGRLRREIKKPDLKKALVELKSGQKIDLFEAQSK